MNRHKILCANCRKGLYWYSGDFSGPFEPSQFSPITGDVFPPKPGKSMECVKCGKPWYMYVKNGSILVLTDKGIRPNEPKGHKKSYETLKRLNEETRQMQNQFFNEDPGMNTR